MSGTRLEFGPTEAPTVARGPFAEVWPPANALLAGSVRPLPQALSLEFLSVPRLLVWLADAQFDGVLRLWRDDRRGSRVDKALAWESGQLVQAESSLAQDQLAVRLAAWGKVGDAAVQVRSADDPEAFDLLQTLVDAGHLKAAEVNALRDDWVAEIACSLFDWCSGQARVEAGAGLRLVFEQRAAVTIDRLLWDGIVQRLDGELLEQSIGSAEVRLLCDREVPAVLPQPVRDAARLFDGCRTLAEVGAALDPGTGRLQAYQVAYALLTVDAAVRLPAVEPEAPCCGVEDAAIDRRRVLAKHAQVERGDYFSLLGVSPTASAGEIAAACARLRRVFAPASLVPDVAATLKQELSDIAQVIDEAGRILGDARLRRAYRETL